MQATVQRIKKDVAMVGGSTHHGGETGCKILGVALASLWEDHISKQAAF